MKNRILIFLLGFGILTGYSQSNEIAPEWNLDFESVQNGNPVAWSNFGDLNYQLTLDSAFVQNGKYAAVIEYKEGEPGFSAWAFTIPESYSGKRITLSAYMKTEQVTDGYAGLWMRIDPSIAFDNMNKRGVKGTTDWTKYEITLDMIPEKTEQIVFGGLLVGKGKVWIDHFTVRIDGKEIQNLKPLVRKLLLADQDKQFDEGSGITNLTVNEVQIENLKLLGFIWGFLKYYHPNIAKGDYNWDYELFRILPQIQHAENEYARDRILVNWINGLGAYSKGKEKKTEPSKITMEPDLDWMNTCRFSNELKASLLDVKNAKRTADHYYIGLEPGVGNPEFKNEKPYSSFEYPDAGFRLLALYKYWNMIHYYFPYKNLIEEDWKTVLEEFIPKVIKNENATEYTLTILELIGRIHDTHANVWGGNRVLEDYFGLRYAPIELTFVGDKSVVKDYYSEILGAKTGLKKGDVITAVNGKSVATIVQEKLHYYPASNYPTKLREIAYDLLRTNDSTLRVEFIRNDQVETAVLQTYSFKEMREFQSFQAEDTCFKWIDNDIAYLNNGSVQSAYLPEIWKEIAPSKGLIIDIRNYPSDFVIYDLSNYLLSKKTPFAKFSIGSIETPGLFTTTDLLNVGKKNKDYYKGKVVILVNETTQSSAEFHSMAYRVHPNALVIGSTTAGADGDVSEFYLPGGITTMISGIGVYYPDGKETQRIGIVPDIEVKPSIQGIQEGRDELIEKAIQLIKGN